MHKIEVYCIYRKKDKILKLDTQITSAVPIFNDSYPLLYQEVLIVIQVNNCPVGYTFNYKFLNCQCLVQMDHHDVRCNYETFTVSRLEGQWLSPTIEHAITQQQGVIVHDQCPYDYCRTDPDSLTLRLEFPDDQCAFNRSGILCGTCLPNLSQLLGSSQCRQCSNIMLLVIIPASIVAGILLVGFLVAFNLTVTTGTINGLMQT